MSNHTTTSSRADVQIAIQAINVLDYIGLVYCGTLLVLVPWGMYEQRAEMDFRNNPTARGCLWLLLILLLQLNFFIIEFTMYHEDFSPLSMRATCHDRARFLALAWVMCKQLVYLYLFERAVIVHKSVRDLIGPWFIGFRNLVGAAIMFGVGAMFYWACIVTFVGIVYVPENVCVLASTGTYVLIMFVTSDVLLSAALLFLFIYPMVQHLQGFKRTGMEDRFENQLHIILRKNMVLSALVTSSAFVALVAMLVLTTEATANPATSEHLIIYGLFAPSLDTLVCLTLILQISDLWKPRVFKKYCGWGGGGDGAAAAAANLSAAMSMQEKNRIQDEEAIVVSADGEAPSSQGKSHIKVLPE